MGNRDLIPTFPLSFSCPTHKSVRTHVFFSPGSLFKFVMDVAPFVMDVAPTSKYDSFWGGNGGNAKCTTWCNSSEKEIDSATFVNSSHFLQTRLIGTFGTTKDLETVFLMHLSPSPGLFFSVAMWTRSSDFHRPDGYFFASRAAVVRLYALDVQFLP